MLQVLSELCRRLWSSWGCNRKHWCLHFQGKNVVKITVTESVSMGGPESMWLPEKSLCSDGWWAALAAVKRLGMGYPGLYFCLLSGQMLSGGSSALLGFNFAIKWDKGLKSWPVIELHAPFVPLGPCLSLGAFPLSCSMRQLQNVCLTPTAILWPDCWIIKTVRRRK